MKESLFKRIEWFAGQHTRSNPIIIRLPAIFSARKLHEGKQEKARRARQIARHQLKRENGLKHG